MLRQILSDEVCREVIEVKREVTTQNNIFSFCVIDCAIVNDKLVVYEWQRPLNSGIQKEVFLELIRFFDQKIFVSGGNLYKVGVRGKDKVASEITDPFFGFKILSTGEFFSSEFDPKKVFTLGKKNLLILDSLSDGPLQVMQCNYLNRQNLWGISWVTLDSDLGPSEMIFHSKYMQRLVLSGMELNPPFVFIENKESYSQEEIDIILNQLKVLQQDSVVIKKDNETMGRGNTFLPADQLFDYLNSEAFKKNYYEDVLLIEAVQNQKKNNEYYYTERYAVSIYEEQACFSKVYQMRHSHINSHNAKQEDWHWYEEDERKITDEKQKSQLRNALAIVHETNYAKLILDLLSSDNKIMILLGLKFLDRNYRALYIDYEKSQELQNWQFSLQGIPLKNIPIRETFNNDVLSHLQKFTYSSDDKIQRKTKFLIEEIVADLRLLHYGIANCLVHPIESASVITDLLNDMVLMRTNQIKANVTAITNDNAIYPNNTTTTFTLVPTSTFFQQPKILTSDSTQTATLDLKKRKPAIQDTDAEQQKNYNR